MVLLLGHDRCASWRFGFIHLDKTWCLVLESPEFGTKQEDLRLLVRGYPVGYSAVAAEPQHTTVRMCIANMYIIRLSAVTE